MVSNSQVPDCVEHNHLTIADIPVCWAHAITNVEHLLCSGLEWRAITSDTCARLQTQMSQECHNLDNLLFYSVLVF